MSLTTSIPALPVADVATTVAFYCSRLGFEQVHVELTFAVLRLEAVEVHLWQASDTSWSTRPDLATRPVQSGAESFLAGTASCRFEVSSADELEVLFGQYEAGGVLHPVSTRGVEPTSFGVRQFHVLDPDGNLVTFFARLPDA